MGYIHHLELRNFKSYEGSHTIGPFKQQSMTAIIGPNGSGKSNLMDAISFVLRCKTESTRGKNLKELIHRGSKSKGCFVTMDFVTDNDEHIRFSRAINNSGSSEFRINDRVVKKNEYNSALEQIDILVKTQNFLVFQGNVQNIASQSPKELTSLIEEVSSSIKYKEEYELLRKQKDEADESAVINYHRRKTCSKESRQYKVQKDEAEKFQKLADDLSELRVQQALFQLFYIDRDTKKHDELLQKEKVKYDEHVKKQADLQEEMNDTKKERGRVQKQLIKSEQQASKTSISLEKLGPELVSFKEKIRHAESKAKSLEDNLKKLETDRANQVAEIKSLESELKLVKTASKEYEKNWERELESCNLKLTPSQESEYQKLKAESARATAKLSQELSVATSQRTIVQERLSRLELNKSEIGERSNRITEDKRALEERVSQVKGHIDRVRSELTSARNELSALKEGNENAKRRQVELQQKLESLEEVLQSARVSSRENQRENAQKETLETLKRLFNGVRGRLLDLCKIRHGKYNVAVTVAMGSHMNSIVVDDRKTAMECIKFIKMERMNFTFLPLDFIKAKPIDQSARQLGGSKKLILDVIEYDPSIERAVVFAVGNTVVCDNLEEARKLCYGSGPKKYRCVSLDGSLINKSGLMTGGISGIEEKSSKWNEKDLAKKTKEKDDVLQELHEIRLSLRSIGRESQLETLCQRLQNSLGNFESDLKDSTAKISSLDVDLSAITADQKRIEKDIATCIKSLEGNAVSQLQDKIKEIENEIFAQLSAKLGLRNIQEFQAKSALLLKERADKELQFHSQISRLENQLLFEKGKRVDEKIEDVRERLDRVRDEIDSLQEEIKKSLTSEKKLQSQQEKFAEEQKGLKTNLKSLHEKYQSLRDQVDVEAKSCTSSMKKINSHESEKYSLRNKRMGIYRDCKLRQIAIPFISDDVEMSDESPESQRSISQREDDDEDKREVDFSVLVAKDKKINKAADYDNRLREFDEKIQGISLQLEKIAPNMRAIDQFKLAEDRLGAAQNQLEVARSTAIDYTKRFNLVKEKRKLKFNEAFVHIRDVIDTIYKKLTFRKDHPGGNAYLVVENTEEPYLGGVKYTAMPPKKRYLDLEQLSGGEKTVAALALVFAIHTYQPSPFFVLDEIDAALDPGNVGRVGAYLKGCVREGSFQCIIISLKPKLFQQCDDLVGVFREGARSKTLTLSLADRFEDEDDGAEE